MLDKVSFTGGAEIGWLHAMFPSATLSVTRDKLDLKVFLMGRYLFSPEQVVAIDQGSATRGLARIEIHHNISYYPQDIVFLCTDKPSQLIAQVEKMGFLPSAHPDSVQVKQGIPTKWQSLVALVVFWNLFIIVDIYGSNNQETRGFLSTLVMFLLFSGSIAIQRARWLQRLILKPGRSPGEIKAWLYMLAFMSGLMSIVMACSLLVRD